MEAAFRLILCPVQPEFAAGVTAVVRVVDVLVARRGWISAANSAAISDRTGLFPAADWPSTAAGGGGSIGQ